MGCVKKILGRIRGLEGREMIGLEGMRGGIFGWEWGHFVD